MNISHSEKMQVAGTGESLAKIKLKKDKIAAIGASAVALFGVATLAKNIGNGGPTVAKLESLQKKPFTFSGGQGIDNAIEHVDPKTLASDPQTTAKLEEIIGKELPAGVPQPNETVQVPIVPGAGPQK
jgi:hypothetical protein